MADPETSPAFAEAQAETSKQGLRRMRRLASQARSLGALPRGVIHPTTGEFIFPAASPLTGHLVSPLCGESKSRSLPTSPLLGPSRDIAVSPDGSWFILFHPQGQGGTLAIYPRSILSPLSIPSTVVASASLILPNTPLAITQLFPPRTQLASGQGAPLGPAPPPSYSAENGPALFVLTSDALLLIHPAQYPSSKMDGTFDWQMNVLKAPLHSRARIVAGQVFLPTTGEAVTRGWMGMVPGERGVWIAVEVEGRTRVSRADVGTDDSGRWFIDMTPIATLPQPSTSPEVVNSTVQGVSFIPISHSQRSAAFPEGSQSTASDSVGATVVYQDYLQDGSARARFHTVGFELREASLAEGFGEISGQGEVPSSWDWYPMPGGISENVAPAGTTVVELLPLPSAEQPSSAVVILSTPTGITVANLDLASTGGSESGTWSAVRSEIPLGDVDLPTGLIASSGAARGGIGLIGVLSDEHVSLIVTPQPDVNGTLAVSSVATQAAESIVLAMKQGIDWSDVVRAAQGSVSEQEHGELAKSILTAAHDKIKAEPSLNLVAQVFRLQVALFKAFDTRRRDFAAELVRLNDASSIFSVSAAGNDGSITFDYDTVWPLISVAEWTSATIASILRDVIVAYSNLKADPTTPLTEDSLRLLYVLNPALRSLLLRLLSQLHVFVGFVSSLNRPILAPDSRMMAVSLTRDPRAAILAKDRMKTLASDRGIDLQTWGRALATLHKANKPSDSDVDSFLHLEIKLSPQEIQSALENLPTPSSLFSVEAPEVPAYDAITYAPLPRVAGAKCSRCGWHTVSLRQVVIPRGAWSKWREAREDGCSCGGSWVR